MFRRIGSRLARTWSAALLVILLPLRVAAQEPVGTIRGRVATDGGASIAGVRVIARSPALTLHRETLTGPAGTYALTLLPPGDYVLTFERDGFVAVKHVTKLSANETIAADVTMAAAANHEEFIAVTIDAESFPQAPAVSAVQYGERFDWLPVEGGLFTAFALAPGPVDGSTTDALTTLDGSPVRFLRPGSDRPVVEPGSTAFDEATVIFGAVPIEATRFRSGVVSAVTRPGGDRLAGTVEATLTGADRFADVVSRARETRGTRGGVAFSLGGPLDGRRSWLFGAGRRMSDPVDAPARLTDFVAPGESTDQFWQVSATHALSHDHRLLGQALRGTRSLGNVAPAGAVSLEDLSAAQGRDLAHRLVAGAYQGVFGDFYVTARVAGESRRARASDLPGETEPDLVWDRQTGAVLGGSGSCTDCLLDRRANTAWIVTAGRPFATTFGEHHVTVGAERGDGRIDLAEAPAPGGTDLLASRLVVSGGRVFPVLEPNGSSWIVRRLDPPDRLSHGSYGLFIGDDWRHAANLTVHAGLRWDRQTLAVRGRDSFLSRSGVSPRLHASWGPAGGSGWTFSAGVARYEADLLHLFPERIQPAGDWFVYDGPPINAGSGALISAAGVVSQASTWLRQTAPGARFTGLDATLAVLAGGSPGALGPALEWTVGASRRIGYKIRVRADLIDRRARPFHETAPAEGATAFDATARSFEPPAAVDLGLLTTRYTALVAQMQYDLGLLAGVGAHYTLSKLRGVQDDAAAGEAIAGWAAPSGDLAGDRRHRVRLWGHAIIFENESRGTARVDLLQTFESGRPYGVVSWIDAGPWIPGGPAADAPVLLPYHFTARDEFRTEGIRRTDLSFRYMRPIPATLRSQLVVALHVLNVFGTERVVDPELYSVAATALTDPSRFAAFNPFGQAAQAGVHWEVDPRLTRALETAPLTLPRAYRLTLGVRF